MPDDRPPRRLRRPHRVVTDPLAPLALRIAWIWSLALRRFRYYVENAPEDEGGQHGQR